MIPVKLKMYNLMYSFPILKGESPPALPLSM